MDTEDIKAYIIRMLAAFRGKSVEDVGPLDRITTKEAAYVFGFQRNTGEPNTQAVHNVIQKKQLTPTLKQGRHIYFTWAELEHFLRRVQKIQPLA